MSLLFTLLLQSVQVPLSAAVAVPLAKSGQGAVQVKPVVRREDAAPARWGSPLVDLDGDNTGGASMLELGAGASVSLSALAGRMDGDIEATLRRHSDALGASESGKVLYVVYSGSQFYQTRVKWLVETWASSLVPSDLVVISDRLPATAAERAAVGRATIHPTSCQAHSHEEGMCCKLGEAAVLTAAFFNKYPEYKWAYLSDDDVYVRPDAVRRHLEREPPTKAPGRVLGTFGCTTEKCHTGLCGGGGYAADVGAMNALVNSNLGGTAGFLKETMANCVRCAGWADMALSQIFFTRGLETRPFAGSYPFRMKKPCFDSALADTTKDPLEFHYIVSEQQMRLLHNVFTGAAGLPSSSSAPELCTSFRGRTVCANSSDNVDMPWDASSTSTC